MVQKASIWSNLTNFLLQIIVTAVDDGFPSKSTSCSKRIVINYDSADLIFTVAGMTVTISENNPPAPVIDVDTQPNVSLTPFYFSENYQDLFLYPYMAVCSVQYHVTCIICKASHSPSHFKSFVKLSTAAHHWSK